MCWSVPTQTQTKATKATTTTATAATSVKFPPTERPTASSPKEDTRSTTQTPEPAHPPPTSSIRKNVDVDVTNLLMLGVCAFGICSCYLCYGYLHELLSTQTSHNHKEPKMTSFLILTQSVTNTIAAFVWTRATSTTSKSAATKRTDRLNHRLLFLTAFCYSMAMSATNESLRYVSYPTATLAKSSKLIPTMAVGYFVERKSYRKQEWMGALLLTVGIVAFHWSRHVHSEQQTTDSRWGVALLVTSLAMDGLLGSCQNLLKESSSPLQSKQQLSEQQQQQSEQPPWKGTFGGKTLSIPTSDSTSNHNSSTPSSNASNQASIRTYRPPTAIETMLYVNLYSLLWIGPAAWWSGQCTHVLSSTSTKHWRLIAQLNLCAVLGQAFIFTTVQRFSPLMCTTLTTTRKFGTILLSVYRFDHQFSTVQWTCVVMVFSGLYLQIVSKVMVLRRHPKTE